MADIKRYNITDFKVGDKFWSKYKSTKFHEFVIDEDKLGDSTRALWSIIRIDTNEKFLVGNSYGSKLLKKIEHEEILHKQKLVYKAIKRVEIVYQAGKRLLNKDMRSISPAAEKLFEKFAHDLGGLTSNLMCDIEDLKRNDFKDGAKNYNGCGATKDAGSRKVVCPTRKPSSK